MPKPDALVNELATTLESHIAGKGGISGTAMKLGFNALKKAKPDVARRAVRQLLPDVAGALDELHAEFEAQQGSDFAGFLAQHAKRASAAVIERLDARLGKSDSGKAKALYQRFRGAAQDDLRQLLPAFGKVLASHLR